MSRNKKGVVGTTPQGKYSNEEELYL